MPLFSTWPDDGTYECARDAYWHYAGWADSLRYARLHGTTYSRRLSHLYRSIALLQAEAHHWSGLMVARRMTVRRPG